MLAPELSARLPDSACPIRESAAHRLTLRLISANRATMPPCRVPECLIHQRPEIDVSGALLRGTNAQMIGKPPV